LNFKYIPISARQILSTGSATNFFGCFATSTLVSLGATNSDLMGFVAFGKSPKF
jgi:hypothetical protein